MTGTRGRIEVLHGVNLNLLGARDPLHYGTLTLAELEAQMSGLGGGDGAERELLSDERRGEYVERLHALEGPAHPGRRRNPQSRRVVALRLSIHDALELTGLPAVEVHLSDVNRASRGGGCR